MRAESDSMEIQLGGQTHKLLKGKGCPLLTSIKLIKDDKLQFVVHNHYTLSNDRRISTSLNMTKGAAELYELIM